ncbi:hypothetical protein DSM3645_04038 [Blastopirellula marina DSM 3645]|uniref:Uncharacterized protein n=1 Tax=Blastopirellula marina DSM 3645 TaxID=314230 RepID=A3ZV51_9BACT|nr:hypothetical protein DSM3645_04038 [Blastopirellula marina DSM 3645]
MSWSVSRRSAAHSPNGESGHWVESFS